MPTLKASVAMALSLTVLQGCVTPRLAATVEADAIGRSDPAWTYAVVAAQDRPAMENGRAELVEQSVRMLETAGMRPAGHGKVADVRVTLGYRVEGPRPEGARYERIMELAAARSGQPIWRVTVSSLGSTGDLRHVAPFLLLAAQPHIGRTTAVTLVELEETDPRADAIRRGPRPSP